MPLSQNLAQNLPLLVLRRMHCDLDDEHLVGIFGAISSLSGVKKYSNATTLGLGKSTQPFSLPPFAKVRPQLTEISIEIGDWIILSMLYAGWVLVTLLKKFPPAVIQGLLGG